MKDLPMDIPKGFKLAVITKRGDPRDAFVSNQYDSLEELPPGSIIGTSSLRRQSQIQAKFPKLKILPLRGNLQTRLKKLDEKNYDAIILAAAGLIRMDLKERIKLYIDSTLSIPAVGQGALGIEILENNTELLNLIAPLNNDITSRCVLAERTVSRSLAGSCTVPLGAHATIKGNKIYMRGFVATPDGSQIIFSETSGPSDNPENVGKELSQLLIAQGAKKILGL